MMGNKFLPSAEEVVATGPGRVRDSHSLASLATFNSYPAIPESWFDIRILYRTLIHSR